MFGIDSSELMVIAVVALVVIGPKDLPRVMRTVGQFVGRARGMAKHFRSGIDAMIRETELQDMEKKWKADNERIMREHPALPESDSWAEPIVEADPPEPLPRPKPARTKTPRSTNPPPPRRRPPPRAAGSNGKSPPPPGEGS